MDKEVVLRSLTMLGINSTMKLQCNFTQNIIKGAFFSKIIDNLMISLE